MGQHNTTQHNTTQHNTTQHNLDNLGELLSNFRQKHNSSIKRSVTDSAQQCSSIDRISSFCDKTCLEDYAKTFHPIFGTIVDALSPSCTLQTKVKTMEQLAYTFM